MNVGTGLMEMIEDNHVESPIKPTFSNGIVDINDEQKIKLIQGHFKKIMNILGLNLNEDGLRGTPHRVAKMYVKEIFDGLNPDLKPEIRLFENDFRYNEMLIEKDIALYSFCEHHFLPIIGKVHVGYYCGGKVIGLSKINRLVQYYARRPQVQERLTKQIADGLKEALHSNDVAVIIEATHLCVASRGIKDISSTTITESCSGKFQNEKNQMKFIALVNKPA